jgi:hypothetical protein
MKRRLLHLFIHASATAVFLVLGFIAFSFHEEVRGRPPASGVSLGLTMELIVMVHLVLNLMMALVPRISLKLAGVVVFVATTVYYLLPEHPVRALFLAVAGASCCLLAILLCSRLPLRARVG